MKALVPLADSMWSKIYAHHGMTVNKSWILNSSNDVTDMVKRFNKTLSRHARQHHVLKLLSYDFKNMYTNINLPDLKARMARFFKDAFDLKPEGSQLKVTSHGDISWVVNHTVGPHRRGPDTIDYVVYTADNMTEWFSLLIDNQFVRFGEHLYQQVCGIPMGTNCAVFVANLYLFTYELDFIRHLSDLNDVTTLKRFIHMGRYVDDLLAIDNAALRDRLYIDGPLRGIYPRGSLQLEETGYGTSVDYMDITLRRDYSVGIATDVYDKRCEPGFRQIRMIRFPHIDSAISDSAKYNILTSQFIHFTRLCSTKDSFVHSITNLLAALSLKNYNKPRLLSILRKLLYWYPEIYAVRSQRHFFHCIRNGVDHTLISNPPPF